jgi:branched-chain amino acid transport system ATP-binding protein
MIEIRDISVAFGGVHALNRLSVSLSDAVVGIIGPNGAGKTTLLNVFSGFVQPTFGSIHAFGTDLLAMPAHRRARWGLRRTFQTEQVVDDLSLADNVRVVLDALPGPQRRDWARQTGDALDFVGLAPRAQAMGASLNAFERRMAELAKALVGSPKVVLLDEPAAGLRDDEVDVLRRAILGVHERYGAVTLLIEHDVDLIASSCSSTAVLDFGELLAFGPTAEVLKDERVKAAYLGVEEFA